MAPNQGQSTPLAVAAVHHLGDDRVRVVVSEGPLRLGVTFAGSVTVGFDVERIEGGLTARAAKAVRWGRVEASARAYLAELASETTWYPDGDAAEVVQRGAEAVAGVAKRPGRPRNPDAYYAWLSHLYVRACVETSAPVQAVAEAENQSRASVRNALHEARRRGLLSEVRRGQAGGHLTAKGRGALLEKLRSDGETVED